MELAQKLEKSELGRDGRGQERHRLGDHRSRGGGQGQPGLVKLARLAKKADEESKSKSVAIADTLGKAYFDSGDAAKAVETQEAALRLVKESGEEADPGMRLAWSSTRRRRRRSDGVYALLAVLLRGGETNRIEDYRFKIQRF